MPPGHISVTLKICCFSHNLQQHTVKHMYATTFCIQKHLNTFNITSQTIATADKHCHFNILLAVHPNVIIVFFTNSMHKLFFLNTFITFLYMFRALLCSSSGGQIVFVQPLVSSLTLGDCSVNRLRKDHCYFRLKFVINLLLIP